MADARRDELRTRLIPYGLAVAVVATATGICLAFRSYLNTVDVAMVLLLPVVVVAARYRQGPSILAAVLGTAVFDFFFVPPYYTFSVADTSYIFTFGVMLVVALIMGRLTARIRAQAEEAQERERHTAALYAMNRALSDAGSTEDLLDVARTHIGRVAGGEATVVLTDRIGAGGIEADWPAAGALGSIETRVAAVWAYEHGEPAGRGTTHAAEADAAVVPIKTANRSLGVVVVRADPPDRVLSQADLRTVQALADQVAVPLARLKTDTIRPARS